MIRSVNGTAMVDKVTSHPMNFGRYMNAVDMPTKIILQLIEVTISTILRDRVYRFNDSLTSMLTSVMFTTTTFAIQRVIGDMFTTIYYGVHTTKVPTDSILAHILIWFAVDFAFYWYHRAMHEVNILWSYHQVHHSSEYMNLGTAFRQPAIQRLFTWLAYLPLAIFVDPEVLTIHILLNSIYQHYTHITYIGNLGWLEYIMNTPSHHRVHHGRNPYCIDKNYAGVFIIWDRMFGTFVQESSTETTAYGLVHQINTFEPITVQYKQYKDLINNVFTTDGMINKLRMLFYGPGWSPGKPRTGDINDIPQVEEPIRKYDVKIPMWLKIYLFTHFLFGTRLAHSLSTGIKGGPLMSIFCYVVSVYYTVSCAGRLLDQSKWCYALEASRCVIFVLLDIILSGWAGSEGINYQHTTKAGLYLQCVQVSLVFWTIYFFYDRYKLLQKKNDMN